MRALIIVIAVLLAPAVARAQGDAAPRLATLSQVPNDNGKHLLISWPDMGEDTVMVLVRRQAVQGDAPLPEKIEGTLPKPNEPLGEWTVAYAGVGDTEVTDEVEPDTSYRYHLFRADKIATADPDNPETKNVYALVPLAAIGPMKPKAAWFNTDRWFFLVIVVLTGVAFWLYLGYARKNARSIFIRRIAGVDAIEDAIGRSTEMGRPVLYVTGIEEIQDIQTIASILILGHVAEMTATYDTEIKVCNTYPMTMVVAEEVVRQGYANAGRLDAHRPENVMFITSEQFAFAAAVNGMILRDRPATNIYFGRFFAESLMLAETGFLTGAVQIAGTAEFSQLPFFVAACDYTLLGEELYAVSAYLSREPTLLAQLKAGDVVKLVAMLLIIIGMLVATFDGWRLGAWLMP